MNQENEPTQYSSIIPGQEDLDRPSSMGGQNPWAQQAEQYGQNPSPDDDFLQGRYRSTPPPEPESRPEQDRPEPPPQTTWNPPSPPSPPSQPHGSSPSPASLTQKETNQWAAGAHAGGLLAWIPVVPLIPAVAIYAVYRDRSSYIKEQALEAINFQICILIAYVPASLIDRLPVLGGFTTLVWAVSAVFGVIGAVAALRGDRYRYPFTRRFVS